MLGWIDIKDVDRWFNYPLSLRDELGLIAQVFALIFAVALFIFSVRMMCSTIFGSDKKGKK